MENQVYTPLPETHSKYKGTSTSVWSDHFWVYYITASIGYACIIKMWVHQYLLWQDPLSQGIEWVVDHLSPAHLSSFLLIDPCHLQETDWCSGRDWALLGSWLTTDTRRRRQTWEETGRARKTQPNTRVQRRRLRFQRRCFLLAKVKVLFQRWEFLFQQKKYDSLIIILEMWRLKKGFSPVSEAAFMLIWLRKLTSDLKISEDNLEITYSQIIYLLVKKLRCKYEYNLSHWGITHCP